MKTYLLLFRGINVGGKNLLPMKELVELLGRQGFQGVKSYIQSGNVVVTGKRPTVSQVQEIISNNFGFTPDLLVLDKAQFEEAVKGNPFKPSDGKAAHIYFCNKKPIPDTNKLQKYCSDLEEYKIDDKFFYLHAPDGIGRSKLVANIEACLGVMTTGRNLNTVNKLMEMMQA